MANNNRSKMIFVDPSHWITATGVCEKERDGMLRSGWVRRRFVLTTSHLCYYRCTGSDSDEADADAYASVAASFSGLGHRSSSTQADMVDEEWDLLGEPRGSINLAEIEGVQLLPALPNVPEDDVASRVILITLKKNCVVRKLALIKPIPGVNEIDVLKLRVSACTDEELGSNAAARELNDAVAAEWVRVLRGAVAQVFQEGPSKEQLVRVRRAAEAEALLRRLAEAELPEADSCATSSRPVESLLQLIFEPLRLLCHPLLASAGFGAVATVRLALLASYVKATDGTFGVLLVLGLRALAECACAASLFCACTALQHKQRELSAAHSEVAALGQMVHGAAAAVVFTAQQRFVADEDGEEFDVEAHRRRRSSSVGFAAAAAGIERNDNGMYDSGHQRTRQPLLTPNPQRLLESAAAAIAPTTSAAIASRVLSSALSTAHDEAVRAKAEEERRRRVLAPGFSTVQTAAARLGEYHPSLGSDSQEGLPPPKKSWSPCDATDVRLRGPSYLSDGVKVRSQPGLYTAVACDMLAPCPREQTRGTQLRHIASRFLLRNPNALRFNEFAAEDAGIQLVRDGDADEDGISSIVSCPIPRLICLNIIGHTRAPSVFGDSAPDAGRSISMWFHVTRATLEEVVDTASKSEGEETPSASAGLELFSEFFHLAFDESSMHGSNESALDFRQRFKLLFRLRDDELSNLGTTLGSMASGANGKPKLMKKNVHFYRGEPSTYDWHRTGDRAATTLRFPADYFEIDIIVANWPYIAKQAYWSGRSSLAALTDLVVAFTVEGRDKTELPERVVAAVQWHLLDYDRPTILDDDDFEVA